MKYRTLGTFDGGLNVSAIGIGCMTMIPAGGNIIYGEGGSVDEATATIHRAIEMGVTFFDTAQIYGPLTNEELVGAAIRGKREKLVIATKFAFRFDGNQIVGLDRKSVV